MPMLDGFDWIGDCEAMEGSEGNNPKTPLNGPEPSASGDQSSLVKVKAGEHLFHEGQFPGAMYLIRKGKMRVYRRENGVEIDLETLDENQIIGELSFLDGSLRSASAQALVDTALIKISGPAFSKTLDGLPDWLKILVRTLCLRLRNANSKIRSPGQ
jgi:CRP-like cAMP-binding protein